MTDCIFCKIVKGEDNTKIEKETENFIVINDINPQAGLHLLIIPKKHIKDISEADDAIWKELKETAVYIAKSRSLKGYKLIHNAGDAAAIPHMQVHLLSDIIPMQ